MATTNDSYSSMYGRLESGRQGAYQRQQAAFDEDLTALNASPLSLERRMQAVGQRQARFLGDRARIDRQMGEELSRWDEPRNDRDPWAGGAPFVQPYPSAQYSMPGTARRPIDVMGNDPLGFISRQPRGPSGDELYAQQQDSWRNVNRGIAQPVAAPVAGPTRTYDEQRQAEIRRNSSPAALKMYDEGIAFNEEQALAPQRAAQNQERATRQAGEAARNAYIQRAARTAGGGIISASGGVFDNGDGTAMNREGQTVGIQNNSYQSNPNIGERGVASTEELFDRGQAPNRALHYAEVERQIADKRRRQLRMLGFQTLQGVRQTPVGQVAYRHQLPLDELQSEYA